MVLGYVNGFRAKTGTGLPAYMKTFKAKRKPASIESKFQSENANYYSNQVVPTFDPSQGMVDKRTQENHKTFAKNMDRKSNQPAFPRDTFDPSLSIPYVGLRRPRAKQQSDNALFVTEIDADMINANYTKFTL